jgi:transcriptional regulator with XRE-family HTH domain
VAAPQKRSLDLTLAECLSSLRGIFRYHSQLRAAGTTILPPKKRPNISAVQDDHHGKGTTLPKKKANPVDAHVGYRVRLRRMLIGMSQERLGELLGLTFQQVQKYERGINRIGAGRLYEVAEILGVPISFFYEGMNGVQTSGDAGSAHSSAVMDFLSSNEGIQLSTAFMSIKDTKVRRRILDLVRSISGENHNGIG